MSNRQFTPSRVIHPETHILELGKYKGRTIESVIAFDPSYVGWIRSKPWSDIDKVLMEAIKDVQVADITFGKYKGRTLEWLMENDESYVQYLYNSDFVRDNHPDLKVRIDAIYK
jgi:uncharacterized protein (DUF3820 family)